MLIRARRRRFDQGLVIPRGISVGSKLKYEKMQKNYKFLNKLEG